MRIHSSRLRFHSLDEPVHAEEARHAVSKRHRIGPGAIWLMLAFATLTGCAEVSFKRGASGEAMAADERACRAASADEAAYRECMRKRGNFVVVDDSAAEKKEPVPAATPPPTAPAAIPPIPAAPTAVPLQTIAPAASATPESKADATAIPAAPLDAPAPTPPPAPSPFKPDIRSEAPPEEPTPVVVETDPMAPVNVASWWKLGGTAAGLEKAINACVAELGDGHRPDPGARIVTVAMRACLRRAGWYGFGKSPAN